MVATPPSSLALAPTANNDVGFEPFTCRLPEGDQAWPIVVSSPHSGREYAGPFAGLTHLEQGVLRRSEDAYMDCLIADIPHLGIPTLSANFPRVFVDANRGADEIDPGMYSDRVRSEVRPDSRRTASGLGVIPRISADGRQLYGRKLKFAEAETRLEGCYWPYHHRLADLLAQTRRRFGAAFLLDMHSMPNQSARGADIVLGDRFGQSCSAEIVDIVERQFRAQGFVTVRNTPYAGGHTTETYGRPESGTHVLQIEVNRSLYMDEKRVHPNAGLDRLCGEFTHFISAIRESLSPVLRLS